ncbi:hypothetical protein CR513_05226, partial [Mucuna pruriens]
MCALKELEYEKVHSCKLSKEMWDTLALTYEDNETIDLMFGRFQTIINNLRSLGKTYENYDHITKILKSLASKAFKAEKSYGDTLDVDCFDEDELFFISRKIQSLLKHKRGSRWKNNVKKHTKETKDKMQVMCYECKKLGHFKSECPNLQKEKEKEKRSTRRKVSWLAEKILTCHQ